MTSKKIGFIGLGRIGFPIANNIAKAGFDLIGYDANAQPEYVNQLREAGGEIASSLKELVAVSEVLITVLPNSSVVESVLLSEEVLAAIKPNTICVDITSGFPDDTKRIASVLKSYGVQMLDAPICNGGVPGAYQRDIKLCVGGDKTSFEIVQPIISATAKEIQHVGELGMGHSIKAISNYIIFTTTSVISEAMNLGTACNFDPEKLVEELKTCAAGKAINLDFAHAILNGPAQEVSFRTDLATKDLRYASQLAKQRGVLSVMGDAAHELYQFSVQSGYANSEAIHAPWTMLNKLEKPTV